MKPLKIKSTKLASHELLHLLKDVLAENAGAFTWSPTDRGDAMHISHASFNFRENKESMPPFELHVEKVDSEYIGAAVVDGDTLAKDDAEHVNFVQKSFQALHDAVLTQKKDLVGGLSYDAT